VKREWQETEEILRYFGRRRKVAIKRYVAFIEKGISLGKHPELVGGGLLRSVGGWSEVVSMRRRGMGTASDERILGSGGFVERVISEAEAKEKETLRLRRKVPDLSALLKEVGEREEMDMEKLRAGRRTREVVRVTKLFCQMAVRKFGYTGASVARLLGVTTSLVNRYAASSDLPEFRRYA
jgi:putative transposase